MNSYRNIGKLVGSFGLKGEMVLLHHLGKKTALKGLEIVFLEQRKDELIPYFIESAKIKNEEEIYLKLEGISSREDTQKYLQKEVWLTQEMFDKYAGKSSPIFLVGFQLMEAGVLIGEILEIIEQPHQVLARIDLQGKEALIPLNEQTLLKIDRKTRLVQVQLPDGLLDIYK